MGFTCPGTLSAVTKFDLPRREPLRLVQPDEALSRAASSRERWRDPDPGCASASYRFTRRGYRRSSSRARQPAFEQGRETARERRSVGELFAFDDSRLIEKKPGKFRKLF
jgi:hypothetical protein